MTTSDQRFVTLADVAIALGASRSAVRGWLDEAGIRAFCFGSGKNAKLSYLREDVDAWVEECRETGDDLEDDTNGGTEDEDEDEELELGEQELAAAETCADDDEADDSSDDDDYDWDADEDDEDEDDDDDLGCPASAAAAY